MAALLEIFVVCAICLTKFSGTTSSSYYLSTTNVTEFYQQNNSTKDLYHTDGSTTSYNQQDKSSTNVYITGSLTIVTTFSTELNSSSMSNTTEVSGNTFNLMLVITIVLCVAVVITGAAVSCWNKFKSGKYVFSKDALPEKTTDLQEDNRSLLENSIVRTADSHQNPLDVKLSFVTTNKIPQQDNLQVANYRNESESTSNNDDCPLNITLRSNTEPERVEDNHYNQHRTNVASVFDQPWDAPTSKVNRIFASLKRSVSRRKSSIKGREHIEMQVFTDHVNFESEVLNELGLSHMVTSKQSNLQNKNNSLSE